MAVARSQWGVQVLVHIADSHTSDINQLNVFLSKGLEDYERPDSALLRVSSLKPCCSVVCLVHKKGLHHYCTYITTWNLVEMFPCRKFLWRYLACVSWRSVMYSKLFLSLWNWKLNWWWNVKLLVTKWTHWWRTIGECSVVWKYVEIRSKSSEWITALWLSALEAQVFVIVLIIQSGELFEDLKPLSLHVTTYRYVMKVPIDCWKQDVKEFLW